MSKNQVLQSVESTFASPRTVEHFGALADDNGGFGVLAPADDLRHETWAFRPKKRPPKGRKTESSDV